MTRNVHRTHQFPKKLLFVVFEAVWSEDRRNESRTLPWSSEEVFPNDGDYTIQRSRPSDALTRVIWLTMKRPPEAGIPGYSFSLSHTILF